MKLVFSLNVEKFVDSWNASSMNMGKERTTHEAVYTALSKATDGRYGWKGAEFAWLEPHEMEKFASAFGCAMTIELALQDSTTIKLF